MSTTLRKKMEADAAAVVVTTSAQERLAAMVAQLVRAEQDQARAQAEADAHAQRARELREQQIPSYMLDELGCRELTLVDGTAIRVATEVHPNVLAANKPRLFVWLARHGFDSLIKNTVTVEFGKGQDGEADTLYQQLASKYESVREKKDVHPQTFKAFVREQLAAGTTLPSFVELNEVRTTKVTKGK